ncbi:MAG TPA: hypothetical protein VGI46_21795 [Candidatus Acidoferrum sp.]
MTLMALAAGVGAGLVVIAIVVVPVTVRCSIPAVADGEVVASPKYCAVIECVPTANDAGAVSVAAPPDTVAAIPIIVPPSSSSTMPVGVPPGDRYAKRKGCPRVYPAHCAVGHGQFGDRGGLSPAASAVTSIAAEREGEQANEDQADRGAIFLASARYEEEGYCPPLPATKSSPCC